MSSKLTAVVAAGLVLCGLSQAASARAQAPAPVRGTGVVAGQVIDETTRQPVGGAVVTLTAVAAPGQPAIPAAQARRGAAVANAEGRYVFRDVPAGAYALAATMNNYSPGATGRQRPGGPSGTFTLGDDARLTDVVVSMWRLASISGTVLDDRGEPAIGVSVWALRRVLTPDGNGWSFTGGTVESTDDRGHFRLAGLSPGIYTVSVRSSTQTNSVAGVATWRAAMSNQGLVGGNPFRGRPREAMESGAINIERGGFEVDGWQAKTSIGGPQPLPGPDGTVRVHQTSFYGGTTVPKDAQAITIAAGEDKLNIDLTLPLVAGQRVSGVLYGPTGPAGGHGVRLEPPAGYSTTDPQGRFVFLGIPPGTYTVRAYRVPVDPEMLMRMTGERPAADAGPPAPSLFASLVITVGAGPVDNLALTLEPGARLAGRVVFDGTATPPTPEQIGRMAITLRTLEADAGQMRIDSSGTFQTPGYAAGRYLINVAPPTSAWTLASIRARGIDVAGQALVLEREDVTDIVITFTDKVITLNGTVTSEQSTMPGGATVVVMPVDVTAWVTSGMSPRRVVTTTASATGAYQVTIPLAGDYLVVAVPPDVAPDVDPEFAARFAASAVRVSFAAGDTKTQPLTMRRPR
jgi:Carboxypeptidase regulatory-like domain